MAVFIAILKALPTLISILKEVWDMINRMSRGRPEEFIYAIEQSLKEVNNAETDEAKQEAARKIALMWRGEFPK